MPKSWTDRQAKAKPAHVVTLEKAFAGVPAGARLFIPSPQTIADYARALPPGERQPLTAVRAALARAHGADAACPVATSYAARIAAEAAIEQMGQGAPASAVTPFWRLIAPTDKVAAKLSVDSAQLDHFLELEARGN